MTRYMADSVDGVALVSSAVNVPGEGSQRISLTAGYANGSFHASSQDSGPTDVQIDVNGSSPGADVLDIERGDASPAQAAQWVHDHNAHGGTVFPAVLYCNRSTLTAVANVLDVARLIVGRDYRWWISTLDGTTSVADMTGVVAVQAWGASNFDRNIDLSIVYDDSWKPNAVPTPICEDDDMAYPISFPAAPGGNRVAIPIPVGRQVEITLAVDGEATLTEYGWAEAGGNGFQQTNVHLGDQGSHSFRPFKGTGKVDLLYTSNAPINGVVDIVG